MGLDVKSVRGQVTLAHERDMAAAYHSVRPHCRYMRVGDLSSAADAMIYNTATDSVLAIAEQKSRSNSIEDLKRWNWEWLITDEKIVKIERIAADLRILFVGFLYLTESGVALMQKFYDGKTQQWLVKRDVRVTETQATINGGRKRVPNSFLDMRSAFQFEVTRSAETEAAMARAAQLQARREFA